MALTVVSINVTTSAYTVPVGKIAKVIINRIHNTAGISGYTSYVGQYIREISANDTTDDMGLSHVREHYLIAGQTIYTSNANVSISCTVFLEDA